MTVAELIARLKMTDPDRVVQLARYDGDILFMSEVLGVEDGRGSKAHELVWLMSR